MNTPKEATSEILKELPDTATYDDIMYRIYVMTKLDQARKEAEAGEVVEQEEVEKMMTQWIIE